MKEHSDPGPANPAGAAEPRPRGRSVLGRRRRFLVNRGYQLRVTAMTALLVTVVLVFLNVTLYASTARSTAELLRIAPEFEEIARSQDRVMIMLVFLASLVFLVGVILVGFLESHKTAGAAVNLGQRFKDIENGNYLTVLRLRKHDNLRELVAPFNRMCKALQQRTWDEVKSLEALAGRFERAPEETEPSEVAKELRRLATKLRRTVE